MPVWPASSTLVETSKVDEFHIKPDGSGSGQFWGEAFGGEQQALHRGRQGDPRTARQKISQPVQAGQGIAADPVGLGLSDQLGNPTNSVCQLNSRAREPSFRCPARTATSKVCSASSGLTL